MDQMMSYCGILCRDCEAYKATTENNDELRKSTAEKWSKSYHSDIKPEQIHCMGCRSEVNFNYCHVCKVRACNIEKKLEHCGKCELFPCGDEAHIVKNVPGVKERLETLKNSD